MKMKKLLSIGAITLVLACSTSIGASAATTSPSLTPEQIKVIQSLAKTFNNGKNPVNNLDVNKNTDINSIANEKTSYYGKVEGKVDDYNEGKLLLKLIDNGADVGTILNASLLYASSNAENFNNYKTIINDLSTRLMDIDKTEDANLRAKKEANTAAMIDPAYGKIKFGKNAWGQTTISLEKDKQVIAQLNTNNVNTILGVFNSFDNYEEFKETMKLLGVIK